MNLDIGDLKIKIITEHSAVTDFCKDRYGSFISEGPADFELEIEFTDSQDPAMYLGVEPDDVAGFLDPSRRNRSDTAKKGSGPAIIDYDDRILIYRSDFAGIVQPALKKGKVLIKENQITMGLDSFLRICFSFIIIEFQGLVLHSAGIVKGEDGYVFFGVSETGKSTISGLSQDFTTILSDEIIVIRKHKDGYHVYGTPFYGTLNYHAVNLNKPIRAAFMPVKDTETYLKAAHPITFLSKFLAAVLFFGKEPELINRVLDIAHDFLDSVPFYEMHFKKDSTFWKHIDELENDPTKISERKDT